MNADEPLPSLHEAVLDDATLSDLFRDLELSARVLDVRAKGHPTRHASTEVWSLVRAREALSEGSVLGVQIRYAFGSVVWRDTLMRVAGGTRLVRIQEPTLD